MNSTTRISVVSYLNSKPFIYGLRNAPFSSEVIIDEDIPSVCADKLLNDRADIGLVPIAALMKMKDYSIISNYCIGADGDVSSVLLLSNVPLNEIQTILLDYQSRTSVVLAQILAKEYWKINPVWKNTTVDFEKNIEGNTAGVIIGDRALEIKKNFKFVYDLSGEWKKHTSLSFVFACWVSTKKLDDNFIFEFNNALENGIKNIDHVIDQEKNHISSKELKKYLTEYIDYNFDLKKKTAMELFFKLAEKG